MKSKLIQKYSPTPAPAISVDFISWNQKIQKSPKIDVCAESLSRDILFAFFLNIDCDGRGAIKLLN